MRSKTLRRLEKICFYLLFSSIVGIGIGAVENKPEMVAKYFVAPAFVSACGLVYSSEKLYNSKYNKNNQE